MQIKTKIDCPLCHRMAKIVAFSKSVESFYELECECSCGTRFLAEAIEMEITEKNEIIFKSGSLSYFPIKSYTWSRERVENKNPSER